MTEPARKFANIYAATKWAAQFGVAPQPGRTLTLWTPYRTADGRTLTFDHANKGQHVGGYNFTIEARLTP